MRKKNRIRGEERKSVKEKGNACARETEEERKRNGKATGENKMEVENDGKLGTGCVKYIFLICSC